ncbi:MULTISPECIES: hypothetical protein [unclassified Paenibacillus]|uniref:hypothetical protein n=1 Tax=unclassified Paenibacillus TaxID=185978 RepID=UPI0009A8D64A|nr:MULTISPECIES: hypothetical protein [unclassified Paenibacillus]SLK15969.1 hypothetical protein SAMN06272722_11043 [Paenibacillus sp. RU5A]SOC74142.1 hypothetical protein SAMN05880581_11043 [Paenibacillus sp. RU26A]SOC76291.1 hypothetical protein SAMN05880586_11043 [Paenibacillus sp. RU5M]
MDRPNISFDLERFEKRLAEKSLDDKVVRTENVYRIIDYYFSGAGNVKHVDFSSFNMSDINQAFDRAFYLDSHETAESWGYREHAKNNWYNPFYEYSILMQNCYSFANHRDKVLSHEDDFI